MITELRLQNFKSWQDTDKLQFAPLTGFFGANNSGKTSILQVPLLFKQTVENSSQQHQGIYFGGEQSLINLSSFDDVIHYLTNASNLGTFVSWQLPSKMTIKNLPEFNALSFDCNLSKERVNEFYYRVGKDSFGIKHDKGRYNVITPDGDASLQYVFRCYGIRGAPEKTQQIFVALEKVFEDLFSRIHYIGPRRADPQDYYNWRASLPKDVGQHGEHTFSAVLSNRVRFVSIDKQIAKCLQKLRLIHSYIITPISEVEQRYEVLVQQFKDGPAVRFTNIGFGVSQVLPVLIQCYYADEGSILILEQPEAHLHPKAQSELADILIDVVKTRNMQIILESHSEHLLLRLMRRIAEYEVCDEGISADQTAFYFCEINDGNSKAEQLKVDEYGNISNWPKDFFGDEMGDLAAKTRAEMQRRKANKR